MKKTWIVAGALAFGVVGTLPSYTEAQSARTLRERDMDEQIKYSDLPKDVKEAVDKERGRYELAALYHVKRDGKEFYRAVIDTKGTDKVVRFKPGGELLSEQEARDISDREVSSKARGGAARSSEESRGSARSGARREVKLARDESDGDVVDFDRLPGEVKTEIGRLAKADQVQEVVKYKHRGNTMYRAEVGQGKYTRFIRVGESGKVDEVIEYKRGGKTYYPAEVDERGGNRTFFYTVDESGREVEGLPRM